MRRRCRWLHRWRMARSTGVHRYDECFRCGKRRVMRTSPGYQPVDHTWLEGKAS